VPVSNLVIIELGLAIGLILITIDTSLVYVGLGVLAVAIVLAALRWRGKWFTQWLAVTMRYLMRRTDRTANPVQQTSEEVFEAEDEAITGPQDPRVNLLRLAVPDLVVAHGVDHDRTQVGLSSHRGIWTALLLVESTAVRPGALPGGPWCGTRLDPGDLALLPGQRNTTRRLAGTELLHGSTRSATRRGPPHHLGCRPARPETLSCGDQRTWRWRHRCAPRTDRRPLTSQQCTGSQRRPHPTTRPRRV